MIFWRSLSDDYLTMEKFDWEQRWRYDVFIWVKWVTFEDDPIRSNISVWYWNWNSKKSLEDAFDNFIWWIKNTSKEDFEYEVKRNLKLYD